MTWIASVSFVDPQQLKKALKTIGVEAPINSPTAPSTRYHVSLEGDGDQSAKILARALEKVDYSDEHPITIGNQASICDWVFRVRFHRRHKIAALGFLTTIANHEPCFAVRFEEVLTQTSSEWQVSVEGCWAQNLSDVVRFYKNAISA